MHTNRHTHYSQNSNSYTRPTYYNIYTILHITNYTIITPYYKLHHTVSQITLLLSTTSQTTLSLSTTSPSPHQITYTTHTTYHFIANRRSDARLSFTRHKIRSVTWVSCAITFATCSWRVSTERASNADCCDLACLLKRSLQSGWTAPRANSVPCSCSVTATFATNAAEIWFSSSSRGTERSAITRSSSSWLGRKRRSRGTCAHSKRILSERRAVAITGGESWERRWRRHGTVPLETNICTIEGSELQAKLPSTAAAWTKIAGSLSLFKIVQILSNQDNV